MPPGQILAVTGFRREARSWPGLVGGAGLAATEFGLVGPATAAAVIAPAPQIINKLDQRW